MRYISALGAAAASLPALATAYTWANVHTGGGGGFTPGIVFNPNHKGVAFLRTDIGGVYRLNADDSWTPLTDFANDATWDRWGADAIATDPSAPTHVYVASGMYTNSWDPNNGSILRSEDSGNTWSQYALPFKVGGNMPGRGMGERLAVDPQLNNILYFGARSGNGLWKSSTSGTTWSKVTSFPDAGTYAPDPTDTSGINNDLQGIAWVTFDSTSPKSAGASSRIFVGVADKNSSVFMSNDAGATWAAIPGQPTGFLPHKGKLAAAEKALYISYSDGTGPYDGTNGLVMRYDITKGTWKDITPVTTANGLYYGYGGVAIDAQKPGTIMVASLESWYPDNIIFRSTDSGTTWTQIWTWGNYPNINYYYGLTNDVAPWVPIDKDLNNKPIGWMIEALEIDPFDSDHWLYGTGLTVFGGHDLTKWDSVRNVSLSVMSNGIEETSVQALTAPPSGTLLLSAMGDIGGFKHDSLTTAPQQWFANPTYSTTSDIDFAGAKPNMIARVGNSGSDGNRQVALSSDSGATWAADVNAPAGAYGGHIAISADGSSILWSSASNGVLVSSKGSAYTAPTLLSSGAVIAADKKNATVFYASMAGMMMTSTDSGKTFMHMGKLGNSNSISTIRANPTVAGDLWATTDKGLFHSTDYGMTFTQATGPTQGFSFALGKSTANAYGYNVFGFFVINGLSTIYVSKDVGKTWTRISDAQHGFGSSSANPVAASLVTEGMVFVGTNGRGVFYGTP
ncbi:hypothetical protein MMC25_007274 [Agyrium rufum]|nr:hypothetical protein [Agyrium rufum]